MITVESHKLCYAQAAGEPINIATARRRPGVYRLRPPYANTSAIMVTMRDGRSLYVNDTYVTPFPFGDFPDEKMVWPADVELPDEIIPK